MSVNIEIKPVDVNQPLMTVPEIAKLLNLSYGYSDNNYCLVDGKTGQYTILYDEKKIGRGFEISFENGSICLRLPLPTTGHDIDIFYELVEKICQKMGVYFYFMDDDAIAITDVYSNVDSDKDATVRALQRISRSVLSNENEYMILFGALNPVFIGKNEIREIGEDLSAFDRFMDRIQRIDSYYANPRFYRMNDEKLHGFYFLRDGITTTIPLKADYPYRKLEDLHSYLVQLPDENYIPYDVFVNNISYAEYYDAGHIMVRLNEDMINDFVQNHAVDMMTLNPVKGFYWGKIIDTGYSHGNKVNKFDLPLDEICGVNHIAVFVRWAKENNLLSNDLLRKCPELSDESPDYRNIIRTAPAFRDMLRSGHFTETARDFVNKFYVFNSDEGFPGCVDKLAEKYFGTEKYNSEEFHNEAYLFVPYDESYYKNLSAYIEREWKKYKK